MMSPEQPTVDPSEAMSPAPHGVLAVGAAAPVAVRPQRWRSRIGVAAMAAAVALTMAGVDDVPVGRADRSTGLGQALERRGLWVDPEGVLWLDEPPLGLWSAAAGTAHAVVRARPAPDEPHDIYLVHARLSPEGALLEVGGAYNLTETSAVDERPPLGCRRRFAFVEQPLEAARAADRVRVIDLQADGGDRSDPAAGQDRSSWSWLERLQAAVTRWQDTGRPGGVARWSYTVQPTPEQLTIAAGPEHLRIQADGRTAELRWVEPRAAAPWLMVEPGLESRPGNLVTWAVDRVRAVPWIGDTTMQYVKAVAFSALDFVLRNKEAVTGDTGEEGIAADLGQDSLEPPTRVVPVDPEIGFPPPPLEPWITPKLPGEGGWNLKNDDPFIHTMPGVPAVFATTFLRSDRKRRATRVYVALWDPRVVELHTMAGVAEPKSATGETGPGFIPREPDVMNRLVAACNAGFQSLHGEYGMMSDGVIYLPPKPYGATVAVLRDGSTAFGSWPTDPTIPDGMRSFRQNMTVMVQDRKFNPYGRTWWGGTPPGWEDKTHTVRTGICLTEEQFVGYFYGMDLSPAALARAMIQARCSYGIALDMNAGHSGLEYYKVALAAELEPLGRPVCRDWEREGEVRGMDGWRFRARRLVRGMGLMYFPRYIGREGRDFFYLTMRHVLPGPPIPEALGLPGVEDRSWRVAGLPQHGFPYALAVGRVRLPSGGQAQVLQLDPRMVTAYRSRAIGRSPDADSDDAADGGVEEPPVVAVVQPGPEPSGSQHLSLWWSPDAFSVAAEPLLPATVRVATGVARRAAPERARAALGVRQAAGMLVYVQPSGDATEVPTRDLLAVLDGLGAGSPVVLADRLPLALGGDTDLAGQATRLPAGAIELRLFRKQGPGARRMFQDTPVVPLQEWYPLQARRIRYFKKKKTKDDEKKGSGS